MEPDPLLDADLPEPSGGEQILESIFEETAKRGVEASEQRDGIMQATAGTTDAVRDVEEVLTLSLQEQVKGNKTLAESTEVLRETVEAIKNTGQEIADGAQIVIKGIKGDKGDSPTNEELVSLIQPLIPEPIKGDDGKTPTKEELVALIEPLIPEPIKGDDGKTPTKEQLVSLIKPLIPVVKDGRTPTKTELTALIKPLIPEAPKVPDITPLISSLKEEMDKELDARAETLRKVSSRDYDLTELKDVSITSPTNAQVLKYNSTTRKWENGTGGGAGAVDSVNGQTGVVVLDADDIDDTSTTNKFVTAADITKLGNLSGTNTGDVTVVDSAEIDLSLTGQQLSASIVAGSIDEAKLDASVNASLDLADSSLQPNDPITDLNATAHRVFYSDGSGNVTELALGADGTFLKSNGAGVAPSFATPAGSGDVSKVGTPVNNQVGVWTGDGTLEGDAALTFDTATNTLATEIVTVTDDAYGAGWNGSTAVPTKNAIYDKIESLPTGVTQEFVIAMATAL